MQKYTLILLFLFQTTAAFGMTQVERREFLDAIRPEAAHKAGQTVRFKVSKLNYEKGWAVLVGNLMGVEGKVMDWSKAEECDPMLDKMLWVVAQKEDKGWRVKEMFICSSEPPYWYLKPEVAFARPCGIYAGLELGGDETAEQQCRAYNAKKSPQK
jgi:hypothetical protein